MDEVLSVCLYDTDYFCNVLTRLSIEFAGDEHRSLIYGELLPAYCQACPHLRLLEARSKKAEE